MTRDELNQLYAKADPQKYARNAVKVAVDNGTLRKAKRCQHADRTCKGRLEAHHGHGYDLSNWLRVTWLCVSHHRRAHQAAKQEPTPRVELGTARLRIGCSTTELSRRNTPARATERRPRATRETNPSANL